MLDHFIGRHRLFFEARHRMVNLKQWGSPVLWALVCLSSGSALNFKHPLIQFAALVDWAQIEKPFSGPLPPY